LESYGFLSYGQILKSTDYTGFYELTQGSLIPPRDGSVFCAQATKGTDVAGECALITGGKKASFTSEAVFKGLGFSFSRAKYGDSSFLEKTTNIDSATSAHRPGVLINYQGTIYLVGTSGLLGIPSPDVFKSWGYTFEDAVIANTADGAIPQSGVMVSRVAGQLNPIWAVLPTVETVGASDIFTSSAYLKGKISTNGLAASYWFEYGTDPASLNKKTETKEVSVDKVSENPFVNITGLSAGTKYYFRLAGENVNGKVYGEILNFSTPIQ